MNNQQPAQANRPLDKGFIKVIVDQFPKKINGQLVLQQGTNNPVMQNKYVAIGEVTRWPADNNSYYDSVEFYPGFTVLDINRNGRIFWDSQNNNTNQAAPMNQAQTGGYNQQAPRQTVGHNQRPQSGGYNQG
jgi:hypothetical protein